MNEQSMKIKVPGCGCLVRIDEHGLKPITLCHYHESVSKCGLGEYLLGVETMILRTKAEISEIRERMNNGEPSAKIYADMNKRLEKSCGIKARTFTNKTSLGKVLKRFPELEF